MCNSLLAGLDAADVRLDPFPHIVAANPLDPSVYAGLAAGYPAFSRIGWQGPRVPSNRRYEMTAEAILGAADLSDGWKAFIARHSGPEFLAEVAALFQGHWPEALLAALGGCFEGRSTERLSYVRPQEATIRQDARFEINTPVIGTPSSARRAHLDIPSRLFSALFYMRAPEDDSVGGDLILYRWKDGPIPDFARYELPDDAVEPVVAIPYRANQLVIFPQSVNAIHGVGLRHPTPHMRRYVFLTAELSKDWLTGAG